ncbi:MAG: DUF1573 domain-containing protein [Phycisphaerales bacterium]|jgi:hypothetical protein
MSNRQRFQLLTAAGVALTLAVTPSVLAFQNSAGEPASPQARPVQDQENQGQPRFELDTPVIELGTVLDDEPASGTIRFRNAGTATLSVPGVSTTCGCTVTELPKNEFEPGESVELTVTFDPRGKTAGGHEQTVTFRTNDRANPMVAVKVRATVRPLVTLEPQQVNLGRVSKFTRKEFLVSLTGMMSDFEAYHVTLVGEGAKYFDVEVLGTDPISQDGETVSRTDILVSLRDDAPPGRVQAMAAIRTNDERRKLLTVPVTANIEGDVLVNPSRMSLGTLSAGRELEEVIEVRHGRNEPFKITGIELRPLQPTNMSAMPVEFSVEPIDAEAAEAGKPSDGYRVRLVMPAMTDAGRVRGNLVLMTDVPLEGEVMLPYVGRVVDMTGE